MPSRLVAHADDVKASAEDCGRGVPLEEHFDQVKNLFQHAAFSLRWLFCDLTSDRPTGRGRKTRRRPAKRRP